MGSLGQEKYIKVGATIVDTARNSTRKK